EFCEPAQSYALFPLTPALSLRGRGNRRPLLEPSVVCGCSWAQTRQLPRAGVGTMGQHSEPDARGLLPLLGERVGVRGSQRPRTRRSKTEMRARAFRSFVMP